MLSGTCSSAMARSAVGLPVYRSDVVAQSMFASTETHLHREGEPFRGRIVVDCARRGCCESRLHCGRRGARGLPALALLGGEGSVSRGGAEVQSLGCGFGFLRAGMASAFDVWVRYSVVERFGVGLRREVSELSRRCAVLCSERRADIPVRFGEGAGS